MNEDPYLQEIWNLKERTWILILLGVILLGAIGLGIARSSSAHSGSDFYMYYSSAAHFADGASLYKNPDSGAPYVYPPFAAFLFQGLHIFPHAPAVGVGFALNVLWTILNLALIFLIGRQLGHSILQMRWAILGAVILSSHDLWNNINFSQINPFIFFLVLAGLYAWLRGKAHIAVGIWTFGAWIKVLPVFFILWALIRKFRWSTIAVAAGVSLLCIGLPVLQRGWTLGVQDHLDFYHDFLTTNTAGANLIWRNQSLAAALSRSFIPESERIFQDLYYAKNILVATPGWIKALNLGLLLITLGGVAFRRIQKIPVSITELAAFYLMIHLFSGITWRGHLLTMTFIFVPLVLFAMGKSRSGLRTISRGLIGWNAFVFALPPATLSAILSGFFQSDEKATVVLYEHNLIAWSLLLLFVFYIACLASEHRQYPGHSRRS